VAVGAFGLAGSITLFNLSTRTVLDLGGRCATGGPFEIAVECPDSIWVTFASLAAGGVFLVVLGGGSARLGGPRIAWVAWPALFLSLAWTTWSAGVEHDEISAAIPMVGLFVLLGTPVAVVALWLGLRDVIAGPDPPWQPPPPITMAASAPAVPPAPGTASAPARIVVPTRPEETRP
jgi:hypothetical protein